MKLSQRLEDRQMGTRPAVGEEIEDREGRGELAVCDAGRLSARIDHDFMTQT